MAPSSDCTLRDSAAMLSTNSQRIDTSESDPSSSSTAWSDPDVSESQAACATLRDTSSSLLSICCSRSKRLGWLRRRTSAPRHGRFERCPQHQQDHRKDVHEGASRVRIGIAALIVREGLSRYKVNIDLMRITCLDIDIAPTLTSFGTSGSTAASDDLSDDDVPFS